MLENPIPFGKPTLNNSPLDGAGLDFPCKLREGVYDLTQMNNWTAGEAQTIRFLGSAVHGGGSCQFSVIKDLHPTKASRWKVVHSVIGGCPASVGGNLPGGPTSHGAATFDVVMPKGMPSGRYTFAWTWFNRQGNREIGGGNDTAFFESLPNMFVANLPGTACSSLEDFDLAFPEPGDSVVTGSQARIATTLVESGRGSMPTLGASSEVNHSAEGSAHSLPNRSSVKTTLYPQTATSGMSTGAQSMIDAEEDFLFGKTSTIGSRSLVAQATSMLAPEMAMPTSTLPVATSGPCIPCDPKDHIVCIDQSHYGLCNLGCALSQPLASGTV
ncbi:hypothetical protein BKA66DRAFT_599035 [Pyrenochaeta sp. MPI-SDFR-AT-0127]|nr:hypothetical protein BKA66DRAFT_599035 [Pyrenochaeta sp. MPI-SDFR-AT-0127]